MREGKIIYKIVGVLFLLGPMIIVGQMIKNQLIFFDLVTAVTLLGEASTAFLAVALIFSKISSLGDIVKESKFLIPLVLSLTCALIFSSAMRIENPPSWLSQRSTLKTNDTPRSSDPRCWGNH
jgi:hypothetical protein